MTNSVVAFVVLCCVGSSLSDGGYNPPPYPPPPYPPVKCPPVPNPPYGYVKIVNDRCNYYCNSGYKIQGASYRTCRSGSWWPVTSPKCVRVCKCPNLRSPPYGSVSISNYGCKATYRCNSYYKLVGSSVRVCSYGVWKPIQPKCVPVCPRLSNPRYGWVKVYGTRAQYGCNKGYKIAGPSSRQCSRGVWDKFPPKCVPDCPDLPKPAYGWVNIDDNKATYGCNRGYKLVGSKIRYCRYGRWYGSAPKCVPDCPHLVNPSYGWVKVTGNKAVYGCRYGYKLIGSKYRYCNYGRWTGQAPKCAKECPKLHPPAYGSVSVWNYKATYNCNKGYQLVGLKYRYCKNGVWGGSTPKCIKSCPYPSKPAYGWVRVIGNKATYGCNPGYQRVGSSTRYCNYGRWTPLAPRCVKTLACPYLKRPSHGGVKIVGNKATYYCNRGYYLGGGSQYCYCHYGRWNCKYPTCSPHKDHNVY